MTARSSVPFDALRSGDVLRADDGFTCLGAGDLVLVKADADGALYVICDDGQHLLDSQCDDHGECIGFRRWG